MAPWHIRYPPIRAASNINPNDSPNLNHNSGFSVKEVDFPGVVGFHSVHLWRWRVSYQGGRRPKETPPAPPPGRAPRGTRRVLGGGYGKGGPGGPPPRGGRDSRRSRRPPRE